MLNSIPQAALVGLDWDSWRMRFPLKDARFVAMGEGVLEREVAFPSAPTRPGRSRAPLRTLTVASLPWVRRGAYRVMLDPAMAVKILAPSGSVAPVKRMWCWMCRGRWPLTCAAKVWS